MSKNPEDRRDAKRSRGNGDETARHAEHERRQFARGMAHAVFGRFYVDDMLAARVAASNAKALARIQHARKEAEKARQKIRKPPPEKG